MINFPMLICGCLFLILVRVPSSATALGDLAASMQPGTWAELKTTGLTDTLFYVGDGKDLFGYASKADWDPLKEELLFIGQGHYALQKFISYDAKTNSWRTEPRPYWDCSVVSPNDCIGHNFDQETINPRTGDFYFRKTLTSNVYRYSAAGTWTQLPPIPSSIIAFDTYAFGIEYFPELGGLVVALGGGQTVGGYNGTLGFWKESSNQWSILREGMVMGRAANIARYNPVYKCMLFGSGFGSGGINSTDLYKLDTAGTILKLKNTPTIMGNTAAITVADPGGDLLVFTDQGAFYTYNVAADTWQVKTGSVPFFTPPSETPIARVIAAPISTYGVTLFVKELGYKVYLYKHCTNCSGILDTRRLLSDANAEIQVSPKPFKTSARITFKNLRANAEVNLYDVSGRLVSALKNIESTDVVLGTDGLVSGFYFLKVRTGNTVHIKKLLFQR